jgi:hypothetical protein
MITHDENDTAASVSVLMRCQHAARRQDLDPSRGALGTGATKTDGS